MHSLISFGFKIVS